MATFADIYKAYQQVPNNTLSLADFAKLGNFATESNAFDAAANDGTFESGVKKASHWINRFLEFTGTPEKTRALGADIFSRLNLDPNRGAEFGEALPRIVTNSLPLMKRTGGLPGFLATTGLTSALSAADALEKSDDATQTATAAAAPFAGQIGSALARSGLTQLLGKTVPQLAQTLAGRLGLYGAEVTGGTLGAEGVGAAISGQLPNFDKQWLAETILGELPMFAVGDAPTIFRKPALPPATPPPLPSANVPTTSIPPALPGAPKKKLSEFIDGFNRTEQQVTAEQLAVLDDPTLSPEAKAAKIKLLMLDADRTHVVNSGNAPTSSELAPPPIPPPPGPPPPTPPPEVPAQLPTVLPENAAVIEPPPIPEEAALLSDPAVFVTAINDLRKANGLAELSQETILSGVETAVAQNPELPAEEAVLQYGLANSEGAVFAKKKSTKGKLLFEERQTKVFDWIATAAAQPQSLDGKIFAELAKLHKGTTEGGSPVGISWLTNPELLLEGSSKGMQLTTEKLRVPIYTVNSLVEGLAENKFGKIDISKKSPKEIAELVFNTARKNIHRLKREDYDLNNRVVPLKEVGLNDAVETQAERFIQEDAQAELNELPVEEFEVPAETTAPSKEQDPVTIGGAAVSEAKRLLQNETGPLKVAWLLRHKKKFADKLPEMAKILGVPENDVGSKLIELVKSDESFFRGNDGKLRRMLKFAQGATTTEIGFDGGLQINVGTDALDMQFVPRTNGELLGITSRRQAGAITKDRGLLAARALLREANIQGLDSLVLSGPNTAELASYVQELTQTAGVPWESGNLSGLRYDLKDSPAKTESVFEQLMTSTLVKSGISQATVEAAKPFLKRLTSTWSVRDVVGGELINDAAEISGLATVSGPQRKLFLAARNKDPDAIRNLFAVTAHETGHLVDHLYGQKLLSQHDTKVYESILRWKDTASVEELQSTLKLAVEGMLPKEWHKLSEFQTMLKHGDKDELLASLRGVWALSKTQSLEDGAIFGGLLPAQPRNFFSMLSRVSRKFVSALQGIFNLDGKSGSRKALKMLNENWLRLERGFAKAEQNLMQMQRFFDVGFNQMESMRTSALQHLVDGKVQTGIGEFARLMAPSELQLRNDGLINKGLRSVAHFIEPMSRVVEAYPKLAPVGSAIFNTPGRAHNLTRKFLTPLYGEVNPVTGVSEVLGKAELAELRLAHEDSEANEMINAVLLWEAQQPGKVFDFTSANPGSQTLTTKWRNMPEKQRKAVSNYITRARESNLVVQEEIVKGLDHAAQYRIATMLASAQPNLWDRAPALVKELFTVQQLPPAMAQQTLGKIQNEISSVDLWKKLVDSIDEHVTGRTNLTDFFAQRPSFQSYMRIGDFVIDAYDSSNKRVRTAIPAKNVTEAKKLEARLRQEGLRTEIRNTSRGAKFSVSTDLQQTLDEIDARLGRRLRDSFGHALSNDEITKFEEQFSLSGQLKKAADVFNKFRPTEQARSLEGAKDIDAVEQRRQGAKLIANSLAKQQSGAELAYYRLHPELHSIGLAPQMEKLQTAWENYHVQDNAAATEMARFAGVYHLAFNLPNMVAETLQPFTTVLSQATAEVGAIDATKALTSTLKDVTKYYGRRVVKLGASDKDFTNWGNAEEAKYLTNLRDEGFFTRNLYSEGVGLEPDTTVSMALRTGKARRQSTWDKFATFAPKLYEMFGRHSTRIAAITGFRLAKQKGLSGDAAIEFGKRFIETSAFVGSRATRSLGLYGKDTRALGQLAHTLQNYNFSWLSMATRFLQRGRMNDSQLAEAGFSPEARSRANQAALMLFGTQLAASGTLGLPMAGAMLKLFEKLTGKDLVASLYANYGEMLDEDEKEGASTVDMLLHGFANTLMAKAGLPIDLSSRFAVGGFPGMSPYSGFDSSGIFGPIGGLVKNGWQGAENIIQGKPQEGLKALLPPSVRGLFDLAIHGDATDKNQNLLGLSKKEKFLHGLGMPPDRVRKLREFENLSEDLTARRNLESDVVESRLAELMDVSSPAELHRELFMAAESLGTTPQALAAQVAATKLKSMMPKNFAEGVPKQDLPMAANLARGLGVNFGQASSMDRAMVMMQLMAKLGLARPISPQRSYDLMLRDQQFGLDSNSLGLPSFEF